MAAVTPDLKKFKRVVVKVGSSLLVDSKAGTLHAEWLSALVDDLSDFAKRGASIIVVTSGAIALGRTVLKLPKGELKLEESQAAAAVGQIALARIWAESLAKIGLTAGQVLLTLGDTEQRRNYLNARETIGKLIDLGAVPVINENDTVATSEIRYGDNDRLAARVATMASADLLILLSDIDGLYDAPRFAKSDKSSTSAESHLACSVPALLSTRSDEPTLTTTRLNFLRSGVTAAMRACLPWIFSTARARSSLPRA
jgi:glutamate 5-kinase